MARALGDAVPALPYPRIEEGAHTMAFIEACLASQAKGTWVDVAQTDAIPDPASADRRRHREFTMLDIAARIALVRADR